MTFAANDFARMKIVDVRSYFDNLAFEFVPDGHGDWNGGSGPLVPLVNVQICPADPSTCDTNQNIIDSNARLRYVFQPQPRRISAFYESLHQRPRIPYSDRIHLYGKRRRAIEPGQARCVEII